ncbi:MAG: hypothetical protein ACE5FO_01560 [Parvularculaceae bacterium]
MRAVAVIAIRAAGLALLLGVLSWYFSYSTGTLDIYRNWWVSVAVGALVGLTFGLGRMSGSKRSTFRLIGVVLLAVWTAVLAYQFVVARVKFGEPFNF